MAERVKMGIFRVAGVGALLLFESSLVPPNGRAWTLVVLTEGRLTPYRHNLTHNRRAKIKATSEEPFQSYAQCLQRTGNDLKKCASLHDALLAAFHK